MGACERSGPAARSTRGVIFGRDTFDCSSARASSPLVARARGRGDNRPRDARQKAIAETSAFLTWALAKERNLPQIPRRPVHQGGFSKLMDRPMAKVVVRHWWGRTLETLGKVGPS